MECKHCVDEICTNADCPAKADFCPCAGDYVKLCKYANDENSKTLFDANIYDKREVHNNCTVEIWENSVTGKVSIGWYRNNADIYETLCNTFKEFCEYRKNKGLCKTYECEFCMFGEIQEVITRLKGDE